MHEETAWRKKSEPEQRERGVPAEPGFGQSDAKQVQGVGLSCVSRVSRQGKKTRHEMSGPKQRVAIGEMGTCCRMWEASG